MKQNKKASYKLSQHAKLDLKRIYFRGLRKFGEAQADKCFNDFFVRFKAISDNPFYIQQSKKLELDTDAAYVVWIVFIIEYQMTIQLKLWLLLVSRIFQNGFKTCLNSKQVLS